MAKDRFRVKNLEELSDEELISEFRDCCETSARGEGYASGKTPEAVKASGKADEIEKVLLERLRSHSQQLKNFKATLGSGDEQ